MLYIEEKISVLFIHLFSAISSDILLMLTAMTSLLYLWQDYALKNRKQVVRLPSIQALDAWGLRLLMSAFAFMTCGILAGSLLAYRAWGSTWYLDPKQLWSLSNWILFACVLLARFWVGWRGRLAVWTTLSGVTLVLICFLVLNYFSWSQHAAV